MDGPKIDRTVKQKRSPDKSKKNRNARGRPSGITPLASGAVAPGRGGYNRWFANARDAVAEAVPCRSELADESLTNNDCGSIESNANETDVRSEWRSVYKTVRPTVDP